MMNPIPEEHVLVRLVARQLADAIHADRVHGAGTPSPSCELGPLATSIVAELVGAALGMHPMPLPPVPPVEPEDYLRRMRKFLRLPGQGDNS